MTNFELQILVWGWAIDGHGDISTRVVERDRTALVPMWDDPDLLEHSTLNGERVPDHWALPYVMEWVREGHHQDRA